MKPKENVGESLAEADPREAVRSRYQQRLATSRAELARLDRLGARWANARGVAFLSAAAVAIATFFGKLPPLAYAGAVGFLALYAIFAYFHQRLLDSEAREKLRVELDERGLARLGSAWYDFPSRGEGYLDPDHLDAPDLDLFGRGSLFQLLDETVTRLGEATLASWLNAPAAPSEIHARQAAVRELAAAVDFPRSLRVEARIASSRKADPKVFMAWAEQAPSLSSVRWAFPLAWLLPIASVVLFALAGFGLIAFAFGWLSILAQLGVAAATWRPLGDYYGALSAGEVGFVRFEQTFGVVDAHPFTSERLAQLSGEGTSGAYAPLRRFGRLFSFAELRQSSQVHAVVHLLTLWDLHTLFALERWRKRHGPQVRRWFEALAQLEALCALATFTDEHPAFTFPVLAEGEIRFEATALGHPLLERPVPNDVALDGAGTALLVTGSNMSGKTTLLRAMGINAVLAQAGGPVCAASLRLTPMHVLTSMRVKDSLERGVSYFYAEVKRLHAVLEAARAEGGRALYLLDEILLGTNTRERQIASREVIRLLRASGAIGAVSTHDLTLADFEKETSGAVRNVHFRDHLEEDRMIFDYRLRPGVVDTTNALRVLKLAGIPIREET